MMAKACQKSIFKSYTHLKLLISNSLTLKYCVVIKFEDTSITEIKPNVTPNVICHILIYMNIILKL